MLLVNERIDLSRLVASCAEDRRKGLEEAGLTLVVDVPGTPVWTVGDEARLIQVFGNLIGNAQKFTDRGGSVTVRLAVDLHRANVHVHDTGIGIDAVALPTVFEAYTQADGSIARSRGGLGLGLALVKGVVELHGGSVTAASEGTNKGTAVTVELPLADSAEAGHQPPSTDQPSVRLRRVLIIEDNADSAESLRQYLEFHGHTVSVARSGTDGLTLAATFGPNVVVCDVGLPGMDGYAVATELRRMTSPPELIIAVSGHGPRKMPGGHPDTVFDYYLLKPADPARVSRLLSAEIARQ